jgi:hypothetical protein
MARLRSKFQWSEMLMPPSAALLTAAERFDACVSAFQNDGVFVNPERRAAWETAER